MKYNILHLTPDFNYTDGRSYYVYLLLKYFKKAGHNVYLCSNNGDSFDRVEELGVRIFKEKSLSEKTAFIKSKNYISKIADRYNIDIIHSHHRYYEFLAASIGKKKKIHSVFTALSIVDKRYFVEYKSEKIIAVSECVKKMLTDKFKIHPDKISIIPNFTETEIGIRNSEIGIRSSEITNRNLESGSRNSEIIKTPVRILSIGRFHKEKHFETLLNAIALIKDFKVTLYLIGDGEEKELYQKIIKEKALDVKLIPPQRDLEKFFELADICILTSVRDPLPGFMLQSGLHKKPFIGSNVDGIKEVIRDKVNGLLFEKKNEKELAEKIEFFVNNKTFARKSALNLNKLISGNFTEKTNIPKIEKLYSSLFN